ncbi:ribonuclease H1 [Arctopsyche grandis]|uniref:ribonuclease H1 n=1 Tax=Arctopsyche grandis TaxID=121162 RepID=UPI00406D85CE
MSSLALIIKPLSRLFIFTKKTLNYQLIDKMPFYAVAKGREIGIFNTWSECESKVKGYTGAKFKKFSTKEEANTFISSNGIHGVTTKLKNPPRNVHDTKSKCVYSTSSDPESSNKKSKIPTEIINLDDSENDDLFNPSVDDELIMMMDDFESKNKPKHTKPNKPNPENRKRTIVLDTLPEKQSNSEAGPYYDSSKRLKTVSNTNTSGTCEFTTDDLGYVEVYTDGACSNNGTKRAKAGLGVYFGENHELNVSEPVSGRATNNCGEIQAATKAIQIANSKGVKKLVIKTDSKFVINAVTKWMPNWKRKGWKLANGEPVKNEIDFKDLDKSIKLLDIKWVYVTAHKGILGNERADQLARDGAIQYQQ